MKSAATIVATIVAGVFASGAFAATIAPPPPTPAGDTVDVIQGVKVADPYRWLEDSKDPNVIAWSHAQNTRTRAYLDALPDRAAMKSDIKKDIAASSVAFYKLASRGRTTFAMYNDPSKQQSMLVTLDAKADPKSLKILLDPNAMDAKGLTTIDWFIPSADGSKIAVSISQNGSEDGTLHIYDVETGKEIEAPIARVQFPTASGSMAWAPGGKGFWYTRYPGPDAPADRQHFYVQVYFHQMGADAATDQLVLGEKDGLEKISEINLDNRQDQSCIMAMVARGDGGAWAFYVLQQGKPAIQVANYNDGLVYAAMGPDRAIYAISRNNASNGKILKLKAPFVTGALATAPVLVPESKFAILSGGVKQVPISYDLAFTPTRLLVRDIVGGPMQVRIFALNGRPQGLLPDLTVASNAEIEPTADGSVLYDVSTYLRPRFYESWNPVTGKSTETALKETSPISFDDTEVRQLYATSKDGTRVPMTVFLKKGTVLDGNSPMLVYGYGGYGVSQSPEFQGIATRVWLNGGGIYAIVNTRGGSEFGESWHQNGMLTKKQNVFDDFAAAAQYLVDQHYTSHERMAFFGASNGGILMGAEITQHPGMMRAVLSEVGIYDMLRVERDPNGDFNVTEFGTVKNPEQFKALYAYSPYHHVVKGTAYPAVLMVTGANDGRVNPLQSRKFTAALQAATSSDYPVLLRTSDTSGHGMGTGLDEIIDQGTDEFIFLFDQLGMHYQPTR